ncbi:UNVERIFIED_CONTAM: hypothetical protein HDU68_009280 [Siphonaria sp. JEL0065]|nr:hypothetical protein HDU68_009280 [Siphonaria sp. JEL0065]
MPSSSCFDPDSNNNAFNDTDLPSSVSSSAFEDTMASLAGLIAKELPSQNTQKHIDVCPSCKAKKQLAQLDAWRPASSSPSSSSSKRTANTARIQQQTSTDKTLLSLIEQERAKYLSLESTHTALLANLSHLQQAHRADMSRLNAAHRHSLSTIQHTSREKSDRVNRTVRCLVGLLNRFSAPGSSDLVPGELLLDSDRSDGSQVVDLLVGRIESVLKAAEDRVCMVEDTLQEVRASKKVVTEKLIQREQEMKKLAIFAKEKDDEVVMERDSKMKLEVRVLHLERNLGQRQGELSKLNELYQGKVVEAQELDRLKERFESTCRTVDELVKREKMYLDEIEAASARERKLIGDLECLHKQHDRKSKDFEALSATHATEISAAKDLESRLRKDLAESIKTTKKQETQLVELEKIIQGGQQENNSLAEKIIRLDSQNHEFSLSIKTFEAEISQYKQNEISLSVENQSLFSRLEATSNLLHETESQLLDTRARLDDETAEKIAIQQANTSRLESVAEKITLLQQSLDEHQQQLTEYRETEANLQANLEQRDVIISEKSSRISELEQEVVDLQGSLANEGVLMENIKSKKKEELLAVQERFTLAKSAMDNEVNTLRNQLNAKSAQFSTQSDELARIKVEISELTADRFRLEARCAELTANESTTSRQTSTLAQLLRQKEQDLSVMGIKHEALVEQVRLLEEELHMYRQSSFKRDIDMQKLQSNAEELRRLKELQQSGGASGAGRPTTISNEYKQPSSLNLANTLGRSGSAYNLSKQATQLGTSTSKLNVDVPLMSPLIARTKLGGGGGSGLSSPSRSRPDIALSRSNSGLLLSPNMPRKELIPQATVVSPIRQNNSSINGLEDYLSNLLQSDYSGSK